MKTGQDAWTTPKLLTNVNARNITDLENLFLTAGKPMTAGGRRKWYQCINEGLGMAEDTIVQYPFPHLCFPGCIHQAPIRNWLLSQNKRGFFSVKSCLTNLPLLLEQVIQSAQHGFSEGFRIGL